MATALHSATTGVPMPPAIQSFAMPAASAPGRNVFAFRSAEPRRRVTTAERHDAVAPEVIVEPPHRTEPDPPPFSYLGAFGPQENPILVYKGNGEVVNVAIKRP